MSETRPRDPRDDTGDVARDVPGDDGRDAASEPPIEDTGPTREELLERDPRIAAALAGTTPRTGGELKAAGGFLVLLLAGVALPFLAPGKRPNDALAVLGLVALLVAVFVGLMAAGLTALERRLADRPHSLLQDAFVALVGTVLAAATLAFVTFDFFYGYAALTHGSAIEGFHAVDAAFWEIAHGHDAREEACVLAGLVLPFPFIAAARARGVRLAGQIGFGALGGGALSAVYSFLVLPAIVPWVDVAGDRQVLQGMLLFFAPGCGMVFPPLLMLGEWLGGALVGRLWRRLAPPQ